MAAKDNDDRKQDVQDSGTRRRAGRECSPKAQTLCNETAGTARKSAPVDAPNDAENVPVRRVFEALLDIHIDDDLLTAVRLCVVDD